MDKNKIVDADDVRRIEYFVHTLRIFEAELFARLKDWDQLLQIIQVIFLP